jgi:hypothetical protein
LAVVYSEALLSPPKIVPVEVFPAPPLSSFGLVGFEEFDPVAYATGFLQGGCHRGNPLERTAYSLQDHFENCRPPMDVKAAARRQLNAVMARMPNSG